MTERKPRQGAFRTATAATRPAIIIIMIMIIICQQQSLHGR
jgi:hypothetical protein